jgi:5S rRNA maturation endonuclease (ribonuclease M5)
MAELNEKSEKLQKTLQKYIEQHKKFVEGRNEVWCESEAIYQGKFYKKFSKTLNSLIDLERRNDYSVRTSANHTFTFIRALHSMLVANQPSISAYPASNEESDKDASIAADNIARYERNRSGLDDYISKMVLYGLIYGNAILKTYWDEKDGEPFDVDEKTLQENPNLLYEGNTKFLNIKPRHFWFDSTGEQFCEAKWALEKVVIPLDEAKEMYPQFAEKLVESKEINRYDILKQTDEPMEGMTVLYEYWEKKSHRNGNRGKYIVLSEDGNILEEREHPYSHGELPYIFFTDIDVPGEPWGKSIIELLKDPQKTINRMLSQVVENINTHGVIRIAKFENSPIREDAITTDPIKIVNVGGQNQPPMQLQPASLPAHIFRTYDMLVNIMEHIAGLRSYSRGEMNKALSGFAAQLMIEQDQKVHIQLHNKYKRAIEDIFRQDLSLCKQFWDETRSLVILGEERKYEFFKYNKTNLNGRYNIRVDYGTSLPNDPASRRQAILDLYRDGLIEDKNAVLRMLELGDVMGVFDIAKDARKRQKEEIEIMKVNKMGFGVREFESHKDHLDELYKFFQSSDFETQEEEIKQVLEQHALEHEQMMKQEQGAGQAPLQQAQVPMEQPAVPGGIPPLV